MHQPAEPATLYLTRADGGLAAIKAFFAGLIEVRTSGPFACWGCMIVNAHTGAERADPAVQALLDAYHRTLCDAFAAADVAQRRGELAPGAATEGTAEMLALLAYGVNLRSRACEDADSLLRTVSAALAPLQRPPAPQPSARSAPLPVSSCRPRSRQPRSAPGLAIMTSMAVPVLLDFLPPWPRCTPWPSSWPRRAPPSTCSVSPTVAAQPDAGQDHPQRPPHLHRGRDHHGADRRGPRPPPLHGALQVGEEHPWRDRTGRPGPSASPPSRSRPPALSSSCTRPCSRPAAEEPVTLIATGPLTNVAALLLAHPGGHPRTSRETVVMGGRPARGNSSPRYAEFNIWADPEAADIVPRPVACPFTMCGLNVTHQALATPDVLDRIAALGTPLALICVDLLSFFAASYRHVFGFDAPPLHDPVAVARVIDLTVVTTVEANVAIVLASPLTRGATVTDLHHVTGREPNAQVAITLDTPRFLDLIITAIAALTCDLLPSLPVPPRPARP